jgi:UDP-2-acetamido-2,6-beta-L-arabino-hexul-4-ose reductase
VTAIAITGANGFVGRNLIWRLREAGFTDIVQIDRNADDEVIAGQLRETGLLIHLAGVNRTDDPSEFHAGNAGYTARICRLAAAAERPPALFYASTIRAVDDSDYGRSKRAAEDHVAAYGKATGAPAWNARLANIFGKWARPDYNSAVATFCHNIARGLPIRVNDPAAALTLLYIDDLADRLVSIAAGERPPSGMLEVGPLYRTTVGELADMLQAIADGREALTVPATGRGLARALYATFISYLPADKFSYPVPVHADPRGAFVEMLKTPESGQFSYFTSAPGVTRGEHYHHSKVEKFLVLAGKAHFGFRHIESGATHEVVTEGGTPVVVETIPGWTHNVTNIGDGELVVMLWANEVFDRARPDTMGMKV